MLSGEKTVASTPTTVLAANSLLDLSREIQTKAIFIEERLYGPQPEQAQNKVPTGGGIHGSMELLGNNLFQLSRQLDAILKRLGD